MNTATYLVYNYAPNYLGGGICTLFSDARGSFLSLSSVGHAGDHLAYYYIPRSLGGGAFAHFSPAPVGVFSCLRLRGTQGGRLYPTAQVWVPGGLRRACSCRSKSRNLARITELLSAELQPSKTIENPHVSCFAPLHL